MTENERTIRTAEPPYERPRADSGVEKRGHQPLGDRFVGGGYRPQFASRDGVKTRDGRVLPVAPSKPPSNPPNRDSAGRKPRS